MHLSFKPIGGTWPLVLILAVVVTGLTLWAYWPKLRGATGRWRWVALGLRLAAVLLCVLASLRPSLLIDEKKTQESVVLGLVDASQSMKLTDEAGGRSRWDVAREALTKAVQQIEAKASKNLSVRNLRFDTELADTKADDTRGPEGRESAVGSALVKAVKEMAGGKRVASLILISDGASNSGMSPLAAAQQLRALQIPVLTVGVGSAEAGKNSADLAARELITGTTVFVKNRPEIRGVIGVRGFGGKSVEVELMVEGDAKPVDTQTVRVPEGAEVMPVTGLKYVPETPGEKRLTLRIKPQPSELIKTNNEVGAYLDVLKGGLKVLYLQGPNHSWEPKFMMRAVDPAKEINTELKVIREPVRTNPKNGIEDDFFAPGRYDVYVLGGIPAECFTRGQIASLVRAVKRGAGLMMLGGRSSLGAGGWGSTELAEILPSRVSTSDGDVDDLDQGIKLAPNSGGMNEYVARLGSNPADSARAWNALVPITGYNRLGHVKPGAFVILNGRNNEPVMAGLDNIEQGRSLAFGGETWPWARIDRAIHARFWRQVVLWLSHRENKGADQITLKLDARRVPVGGKLDLAASARDSNGDPITDAQFEATFTPLNKVGRPEGKTERVPLFPQGADSKGSIFASVPPGEYEVAVKGTKAGRELGATSARFIVFQDDRELENPAADPALLRQIAEITGGAALPAEELAGHLKNLGPEAGEYVQQVDRRLWDNWPFFLIFTALLTAEWALRKAKGWV